MAILTLTIYNEDFWNKGLIYSQNIKPLLEISKKHPEQKVEFISFTSLPMYFKNRTEIVSQYKQFKKEGISVHIYPVLFYPTRYMIVNWFWLPWFVLNMLPYLLGLSFRDIFDKEERTYVLRSYQVSLAYLMLYFGNSRRVFDTRTDWIEEARGMKYWEVGGLTDKMWGFFERKMLKRFDRTLFISDAQKKDTLERAGIFEDIRYSVFYNQTDYSRFEVDFHSPRTNNFIYSGSLGHWNNLSTYLKFYQKVYAAFPGSVLYVLTPTARGKIEATLADGCFDNIRDRVKVVYDVPYSEMADYYAKCKYGLQLMEKADSRVGVKYVEYVAAGLVPIVHSNVRGAAYLADSMGLGVVVNDDIDEKKITEIKNKVLSPDAYARFRAMTDEQESSDILYNYLTSKN